MLTHFRHLILALSSVLSSCVCLVANAQYPDKPIKLVVGFPAGGASDVVARSVAEKMAANLKQPVIVENKPGAASNIAADLVAKSAPDGYTILFGTISLAINGSLYKKLTYDAVTQLAPISQLASAPFLLVVNPATPYRSVQDLIDAAKQSGKDKAIHYATAGNGSGSHLFTELFASRAGIHLSHVPYRGAAPAMLDVQSGLVPVTFDNIITTLPLVEAGKLRPLAVSSKNRSFAAPDIPTLAESGVPDYDASSWFGLFAPAGTPAAIIKRLNEAAAFAVKTPEVSATLKTVGADSIGSSSEQFNTFFRAEVKKWAEVVKGASVQVD